MVSDEPNEKAGLMGIFRHLLTSVRGLLDKSQPWSKLLNVRKFSCAEVCVLPAVFFE